MEGRCEVLVLFEGFVKREVFGLVVVLYFSQCWAVRLFAGEFGGMNSSLFVHHTPSSTNRDSRSSCYTSLLVYYYVITSSSPKAIVALDCAVHEM